jgi:glycine cleavage system H protein
MSTVPPELKYTKDHVWARRMPDGLIEVGITDHAQEELGEIVSVDSPRLGQHVTVGEPCASVESVKAVSDVQSPATGEIAAVNDQLASAPDLINQDPYGKGWIARLRPSDPAWEARALSAPEYERLLQTEAG